MSKRQMKKDKKIIPATREESIELDLTDERNMARYRNEIDAVFTGELNPGTNVLIGKPSELLKTFGIKRELYCTHSVVRKIVYPNKYGHGKHNLGMSVMKNLPYELNNPLAITKNSNNHQVVDDSIVVWTNWKTDNNNSVITIIRIEKNGEVVVRNPVVTTFASNKNYLAQLIEYKENILYTKNNKSIKQLLPVRRLVPRAHTDDTLINYNLSRKDNKVNK